MSELKVYCNLISALAVLQQIFKLPASTETISKIAVSFDLPSSSTKKYKGHLKQAEWCLFYSSYEKL